MNTIKKLFLTAALICSTSTAQYAQDLQKALAWWYKKTEVALKISSMSDLITGTIDKINTSDKEAKVKLDIIYEVINTINTSSYVSQEAFKKDILDLLYIFRQLTRVQLWTPISSSFEGSVINDISFTNYAYFSDDILYHEFISSDDLITSLSPQEIGHYQPEIQILVRLMGKLLYDGDIQWECSQLYTNNDAINDIKALRATYINTLNTSTNNLLQAYPNPTT